MRDPRSALAETVSRIDSLLKDGQTRGNVLDLDVLWRDSGVSRDVIPLLLDGKQLPAEEITERIIGRIIHLRETRLRPDGTRHSFDEIAASYGASRASLSNLVNSRKDRQQERTSSPESADPRPTRSGGPLASTQAGIERFFFGQPTGWLSAEPETALNNALQSVLRELERQNNADPMARLRTNHGLRKLAARAPELAEDELELVTDWIETILQRKKAQSARSVDQKSPPAGPH
ncbi:hypothetical protein QFZ24_010042 [Streptomyces phaeochromogenes]|uniref:hypothetical protein n=1 Tax=Streptomyces phaeochromogenes TaxID=1923 RepID=UPI002790F767|nr:hypothetical protein [Streptomyces phaeochromogenes]MDQ0956033.1 hypothetical protein [Streptomyces phaeochromogenes]